MSTRAAIGRSKGDRFEGRYHHSDGYPTWLGVNFARRASLAPNLTKFLEYIVDEHKVGWSSIAGTDNDEDRCYCHWAGREEENEGEPVTDCDLFIEWAYSIDAASRIMGVWVAVRDPSKDVKRGWEKSPNYIEPGYTARLICIVGIDDWHETDWEDIEQQGNKLSEEAEKATRIEV